MENISVVASSAVKPQPLQAEEIFRLYQHRDDDRVRFMAAQWTFEQAWGKAPQYNPNADPEMRPNPDFTCSITYAVSYGPSLTSPIRAL